ncbi:MAG: FG-GAP-like repeat-containing protein [Candidatus Aquicultorales bacterium]
MSGRKRIRRTLITCFAVLLILLQMGTALGTGYTTRMAAINEATRHLGEPYIWGSGWPPGFDCSGFVNYVMMTAGVSGFYSGPYSHGPTSDLQAENLSYAINDNQLAPGDLLFLHRSYDAVYPAGLGPEDTWTHVGIYEGNNQIIQAGGGGVSRRKLSDWANLGFSPWAISYGGARRINTGLFPGGDASFNAKEGITYLSGDFNGDGKSDVVGWQDYTKGATAIWSYATSTTGKIDTVTPANVTLNPSLSWLSGNGSFDWKRTKPAAVDFDGDGKTDILTLYNYGGTKTGIFLFKSTGTGWEVSKVFESPYWSWANTKLVVGDFDANETQEVLAFYSYGGTSTGVFLFKQDATGKFEYPKMIFHSPNWDWTKTSLIAGKDEGTARDNVVAVYDYGKASTGLWRFSFDENGNLIYPSLIFKSDYWDAKRSQFLMSDYDYDGKEDVVAFYDYGGSHTGTHLFSSTGTSFSYPTLIFDSSQWDSSRSSYLAGDFNGDGNEEVMAVYNYSSGPVATYLFIPSQGKVTIYGPTWFAN